MNSLIEQVATEIELMGYSQRTRETYCGCLQRIENYFSKSLAQVTDAEL
ncbi:hypothetical protein HKB21_05985, partial [Vibrio parahaemolyticus]|nr:hypothetical protein [Vibrio parahaemolyticus]